MIFFKKLSYCVLVLLLVRFFFVGKAFSMLPVSNLEKSILKQQDQVEQHAWKSAYPSIRETTTTPEAASKQNISEIYKPQVEKAIKEGILDLTSSGIKGKELLEVLKILEKENVQLKKLILYICPMLKELPKEIFESPSLATVKEIIIHLASIKKLPSSISRLKELKKLEISSTPLETLPPSLGEMSKLKSLDLYRNKLKKVPPEIGKLKNLEKLILSDNQIKNLPPDILNSLTKLVFFKIDGNLLEKKNRENIENIIKKRIPISESIKEISKNHKKLGIPFELQPEYEELLRNKKFPHLIKVLKKIKNNNFKNFSKLKNRERILVSYLYLIETKKLLFKKSKNLVLGARVIGALRSGKLNLSGLRLRENVALEILEIILEIINVSKIAITELNLLGCPIKILPTAISKQRNLKTLVLSVTEINPEKEVAKLIGLPLENLFLQELNIETIPEVLFLIGTLKKLSFKGNSIGDIPKNVDKLTKLEVLDLSYNKIKKLPISLFTLTELRSLSLAYNLLTTLPLGELEKLSKLTELILIGNNFERDIDAQVTAKEKEANNLLKKASEKLTATSTITRAKELEKKIKTLTTEIQFYIQCKIIFTPSDLKKLGSRREQTKWLRRLKP